MFCVVEDEQHLARAKCGCECLKWVVGPFAEPERGADRGRNQVGVAQRRQLDDSGAVCERLCIPACELEREAGLAAAAGTGKHDQPRLPAEEEIVHFAQLALAP